MSIRAPVAIIGLGLRLPGAETLDAFWDHLAAGRSLISAVPPERFDAGALQAEHGASTWGGFVAGADCFDAEFFQISPREAAWMDPQQRFALELAWTAIEDAAIAPGVLAGTRTGVFMGVCHWDYAELIEKHLTQLDAHAPTGIAFSIIANRVSHLLDLRGPSVVNDTACAASLVAVHDAVRALQDGSCTMALAGGVNLCWSPNHFVMFSRNGMLSPSGEAHAFDARANGYVRGEGGAMLLLKPLDEALADGDPIHAVIRATGTNHGGRTSSLTVTNPNAQAALIAEVWATAGVGPETVGFVEAHGPGTPLGDPIEIAGLQEAMRLLAADGHAVPDPGTCGVGSVKTNIGHLEGAAGVAGIVKLVAALRHETLPGNAGFETLNSLIELEGSAFRIQSEATGWKRGPVPRRAGVSSFGFGGTNAHALIEEAPALPETARQSGSVVIPLQARNDVRLRAYAMRLMEFVQANDVPVADLACTLAVGRDAMDSRAALMVVDAEELVAGLQCLIGETPHPALRTRGLPPQDDSLVAAADAWIAGGPPAWPSPGGRRVHVPTTPFLRERHWFDPALGGKDPAPVPHPMLHRNISRLGLQVYRSRFIGTEFFWTDHVVRGHQVMPGVACLEMVRAAEILATGGECAIHLRDIVWSRPIRAGAATELEIVLEPTAPGPLAFRIATPGETVPNVTGTVAAGGLPVPGRLDLATLRAEATETVDVAACYARLSASGIVHGPAFQALTAVHRGPDFVLASLRLSRRLHPTLATMPLHPILLDAAIQAWAAFDDEPLAGAGVPFSCGAVEIHAPCTGVMWAHVRRTHADRGLVLLDIVLADREGRICVTMTSLALRIVASEAVAQTTDVVLLHARGGWRPQPVLPGSTEFETLVLMSPGEPGLDASVAAKTGLPVIPLPAGDGSGGVTAMRWVETLQAHLIDRMMARPTRPQKTLVMLHGGDHGSAAAALAAMLRTVAAENPKMLGAVLHVEEDVDAGRLTRIIQEEAACDAGVTRLRYGANDRRWVWHPVATPSPQGDVAPLDPQGVYWITGGGGALGRLFARSLADRGARHIVLSGRHPCAPLVLRGAQVHDRICDVADPRAVAATVDWIATELGPLRGVIHAAGIVDDAFVFGADLGRTAPVLAPKIAGACAIDQATAGLPLQFFVLFSSIAGVFANPGQSVYAAANAFLDGFAERRAAQVARGERQGTTLSIAWPLWEAGGMGRDAATREALRRRFGTVPLPEMDGVAAFWRELAAGPGCALVLHGEARRLDALLAGDAAGTPVRAPEPGPAEPDSGLYERVVRHLKDLVADAVGLEPRRIRADSPLVEYGLDSIVIVELTARLEEALGPLSKTLFFEHVDLASLARHLVGEHPQALAALLPAEAAPVAVPRTMDAPLRKAQPAQVPTGSPPAPNSHDVAIIGLSVRVGGANDKDAFWSMLDEGRHAFGPVPADRWDHAALLHPERDVLGKTVVRTGAFLDDVAGFDPRYFRISQAEAELMSPEVRLFLQASVEAFEDAGYSRDTLQRRTGGDVAVIVGSMTNEYDLYGFQNMLQRGALATGSYTGTVPNMVSYFYGLTGPSYFLDTMCSASSTCIHEAVHMLRSGRCRMALAGGVSLLLHPQKLIATSQEHFTSKTADVVRGYGVGADGTILGEGVGAVVLKTLADAERDGDHIYAVIKGTGISNAGTRNGFTVPSPAQQAVAIENALQDAAIDPATIGYVEGHGSGTALGDPIEIRALTKAWRRYTDAVQLCPIGTVKSNVAHLLAAAGVVGIAKVLMQMRHGRLAASLHAEALNPAIPFGETPFYVQRESTPWPRRQQNGRVMPRRAAVTSIGAGGMNSHIVLEEHQPSAALAHPGGPELVVLSAMTPDRLLRWAERLHRHLSRTAEIRLADLAWTLQVGRNALPCRLAFVADTLDQVVRRLAAFVAAPGALEGMWHVPSILNQEASPDPGLPDAIGARTLGRVAEAWTTGLPVDWEALHQGRRPRRMSLPGYPFEQVRCWVPSHPDAPSVLDPIGARQKLHPLVGQNLSDLAGLRFTTVLHLEELLDYTVVVSGTRVILPVAVAEMVLAAAALAGSPVGGLRDLTVHPVSWATVARLAFALAPQPGGAVLVTIETEEATGTRRQFAVATAVLGQAVLAPRVAASSGGTVLDPDGIFAALRQHGVAYKPFGQVLEQVRLLPGGGVIATLRADPPQQDHRTRNVQLPATWLAGADQALRLAAGTGHQPLSSISHVAIADAARHGDAMAEVMALPTPEGWHVSFLDASGGVLAAWTGVCFGGVARRVVEATPDMGLQQRLLRIAAGILKFAESAVSPRANFYDLGFDSVTLTRFAAAITDELGVELSPALFFQVEHIEALTRHLGGKVVASPSPAEPSPEAAEDGIAIIGFALRVPGADTPDAFIDRLLSGDDLVTSFPPGRFTPAEMARMRDAGVPAWAGTLSDLDRFDAALFRIAPVEAERLDPRQRLLLETAWRTLEDAGLRPEDLARRTGVFVGASGHDWAMRLAAHGVPHDGFVATGTSSAMIANRLSHQFDLHGPSETVDTACSSSLVALMRAADALRTGQCDMALVSGVNLTLVAEGFEGPHGAGMLGAGGRCRSFGAAADGYVRGEGVLCFLLKPLLAARRDNDRIRGILLGGAVNHGGRAGALTAPNARAQADLLLQAWSDIEPASLGYIEAHGTGTALGDPVEVNGLRLALGPRPPGSVGLGSVKSAIGHLEAAAGLAGVAKVLMAMERGEVPPTLHCEETNPHASLNDGPLRLVRRREAWPRRRDAQGREQPRRAGVSSFGFGGSNAHVVIEEGRPGGRAPLPSRPFAETRFPVPGPPAARASATGVAISTLLFAPVWVEAGSPSAAAPMRVRRIVMDAGFGLADAVALPADYRVAVTRLLAVLQHNLSRPESLLIQIAVPLEGDAALLEGLGAMLDSAALESPTLTGQIVAFASGTEAKAVAALLSVEAASARERRVRYTGGRRLVQRWNEVNASSDNPWRPGGTYLITGGMGGLGRSVARHIASRAPQANLLLLGTTAINPEREAVLQDLRARGSQARYIQGDVGDVHAMTALVSSLGALHGVLHMAGALRDGIVMRKSPADVATVLAPKVDGAFALEQACRTVALDHFVLFSSLAGSFGNPGQADYAAANGFLDGLADRRRAPLVSIAWPLWREGGMRMEARAEAALFTRMGQRPLATADGLRALDAALGAGVPHLAVVAGDAPAIRRFFEIAPLNLAMPAAAELNDGLLDQITGRLRHLFSEISGVAAARIEAAAPLDQYGIDSLMVTRLNQALGGAFPALDASVLFQYRTLQGLARHLAESHSADAARWINAAATPRPAPPVRSMGRPQGSTTDAVANGPIAVIGMAGRYPGAEGLETFWTNLLAGRDMVGEIPAERWALDGFFDPDPASAVREGRSYGKWGAFLDGFAEFDPGFFRIAPREAAAMDPQERLFLQLAWAACEDGGYCRRRFADRHAGRVGVFAGVTKTGFALHGAFEGAGGLPIRPGTSFASVANRVSHVLDLNGPSLPVDTMCSSSLTAIHLACEALHAGTCDMAIAGGVNLYLHPSTFVELSAARMLSPTGRCRSFGAGADGFVPGEGVGCLLLKPLDRAVADKDHIHAVIRATAVNHGGHTNGFTVPNPAAQAALVTEALHRAGLRPQDVTYIEAHGTGTDLGDPIEVAGLVQAFSGAQAGGCALGSVKSAIGHLEAAAGIAGVTKTILQMRHRTLAPTLHATETNPKLALDRTPFSLVRAARAWTAPSLIAGVSSFGAGGANAHVILQEPPTFEAGGADSGGIHPILLSARDPERLRVMAARLLDVIQAEPDTGATDGDAIGNVRVFIASLLGVETGQIDDAEPLEAMGIDRLHRVLLQDWLSSRLANPTAEAAVAPFTTVQGIAALLGAPVAGAGPRLADIAYTLQVGRETMTARLAIEAGSHDALAAGLRAFLAGRHDAPGVHVGETGEHRAIVALLSEDSEGLRALTAGWMRSGSLGRLLALWVKGVDMDWTALPRPTPPRIVSLPTYPFRQERFWLGTPEEPRTASAPSASAASVEDIAKLEAGSAALNAALAPLVRSIMANVPAAALLTQYLVWREALDPLTGGEPVAGAEAAWATWKRFRAGLADDAGSAAQAALAEAALRALPEILTGRRSATEVLFPAGKLDLVEAVYRNDPVAARFNAGLATAAAAFVGARPAGLRVLEIGAGTGGTSVAVFDALSPWRDRIAEYRYTDVSRAFLIQAERRFRVDMPSLQTALFDVERPLAEQGIAAGTYDLVIAANVLHATADMGRTLGNVRQALRDGGMLLLNETSRATLFTHVTFGLLQGWWRATDTHRRIAGTPSLSTPAWRSVLEATGFVLNSASPAEEQALGQQLLVAKAVPVVPQAAPSGASMQETVRQLVADTLNKTADQVAVDAPFADYGLDSILGADLVDRVRRRFGIAFPHTELFDHASVSRLAARLAAVVPATPAPFAVPTLAAAPKAMPVREPIAIVGMSGRFAGSADLDALWDHLLAGHDLVQPASRFGLDARHGSFIEGIDRFDPLFFGIAGAEAKYMDPQQRLFLEEAWKTLEHAGHAGDEMAGRRCGVFVGASAGDYQALFQAEPPGQAFWGNTSSLIPARIAYFLDLKGPALAIDTACSSSLVALHLACRSLLEGECEMALAGGVFVQCTDRFFRSAGSAGMLSEAGRCAAFGSGADGIVPAEAVAAVLLRPLSAALADGDTIYGLVAATGMNQDGATNGITAPSAASQERLLRDVYESAGIDPATITLIEAHGTGTPLGDPIEHAALSRVFAGRAAPAVLGSIKANIGHATTAAGIAGLVKVLLALQHRIVPPTIHVGTGNPALPPGGPLRVATEAESWTTAAPRRAAISSFGFGGTNAHAVIEEAPDWPAATNETGVAHLVVLSARTETQLRSLAERLLARLASAPGLACADIAFTLSAGRRHLPKRLAVTAVDTDTLRTKLRVWLDHDATDGDPGAASFMAGGPAPAVSRARRVALPTYPFAPDCHWVGDAPMAVIPRAAAAAAGGHLDRPDAAPPAQRPAGRPGKKIVLAPVANRPEAIRQYAPDRRGVRDLVLRGDCSRSLAGAMAEIGPETRTVLLRFDGASIADAARGVAAITACPVPVVAALPADCTGATLAVALASDFLLLADTARYGALRGPAVRFGLPPAFLAGPPRTGAVLREAGFAVPVVAPDAVEAEALDLARRIAEAPHASLLALTRQMRPGIAAESVPAAEATLRHMQHAVGAAPSGGPHRVPLRSDAVSLELFDDGVALLRMQVPEHRNMFTPELMDGLEDAFETIAQSSQVKVVVLTGIGGTFACGGTKDGLISLQEGATRFTDRRIYSLPLACAVPVIAAMDGHAIGAGWSLGMFADIRLFGAESLFHSNYLSLGFTPGAGATLVFPSRLGHELGREVLFTASALRGSALAARHSGIEALPNAEVLPRALARAHNLAGAPRAALIDLKATLAQPLRDQLETFLAAEFEMHRVTLIGNAEARRRIDATFALSAASYRIHTSTDEERLLPSPLWRGAGGEGRQGVLDTSDPKLFLPSPLTPLHKGEEKSGVLQRCVNTVAAAPPAAVTAPTHAVRDELVRSLSEELMIPVAEVRDDAAFLDLGLDSIMAVTWIRRLNSLFGTNLPATTVYNHTTVGDLVRHVSILAVAPVDPPVASVTPAKPAVPAAAPVVLAAPVVGREPKRLDIPEPMAIVGASAQFPMAGDLDAFWANIRTGRDCITEVPPDRWSIAAHWDPDPQAAGKSISKWMGALDGIDRFDPAFFKITPREAELMDPQQRLFLQHAWHSLEDAAIDPMGLAGTACGVFVGSGPSGYADLVEDRNAYSLLGSAGSILASRIAYMLDLRGPAVSLDTACSSSLVAIAQACNSLLLRDCDLALAGGASVLIGPSMFVDTSKVGMLSPEGRCFAFDHRANGFVPGEGVGVLVLKRLADALRDGDPVRAIIRGWGVNQDGRTNGITAPNPEAQARLIRGIHARFDIDAGSIDVVECHGTGTALGDPIEVEGLAAAFGPQDGRTARCVIGSVKSNVGHLLAAAGVAGALKAMLALERAELPPTALFERLNPHVILEGTPFEVIAAARPWPAVQGRVRRAAVSAFGFSGTNAHLVLEAAPTRVLSKAAGPAILPVAARTLDQLRTYAGALARFVAAEADLDLHGLAATFQTGRTPFPVRRAIVFTGRADLLAGLAGVERDEPPARGTDAPHDLARRWSAGEAVMWPKAGQRMQAPGYPFAEERHWAVPTATVVPSPPLRWTRSELSSRPGVIALALRDAPSVLREGGVALGLALPMLVLQAALTGQMSLGDLVWGCLPAPGADRRVVEITLRPEGAGSLVEVALDGSGPCLLGTAGSSSSMPDWPTLPSPGMADDVTAAWLQATGRSGAVTALHRDAGGLTATLSGLAPADGIDPALLQAIAGLLAFHDPDRPCPFTADRLRLAGPLPSGFTLRLMTGGGPDAPIRLFGYTQAGVPVLLIEGLLTRCALDLPDLAALLEAA